MRNKKRITLFISILLVLSVGLLAFIACDKKNDTKPFDVPNFTTVDEMLDAIKDGMFSFNNVTLLIKEYEDGELASTETMKYGEAFAYSQVETNVFGVASIVKGYTIPDLADNCIYILLNSFISNGWTCSKTEMTLEGFDGKNLATIGLPSYIETNEIPTETALSVENGTISIETETCKIKIYDFNSTVVQLEDDVKDYKSMCE